MRSTPRLILASQSPRRSELLTEAGYTFDVCPASDAAEWHDGSVTSAADLVARLSWRKAADVAPRVTEGIVIGCDTVAAVQGRILGKPGDQRQAREMLELLRGQEHQVYSGLCLWQRPADKSRVEVDVTTLWMEPLSDQALDEYLQSGAWRGKAGAFGYQDRHGWLRILAGSESNVVGLPLELFHRMLEGFWT